jgi:hypothetical protein
MRPGGAGEAESVEITLCCGSLTVLSKLNTSKWVPELVGCSFGMPVMKPLYEPKCKGSVSLLALEFIALKASSLS